MIYYQLKLVLVIEIMDDAVSREILYVKLFALVKILKIRTVRVALKFYFRCITFAQYRALFHFV